ncbi:MAG: cation:proton antiporter [Candidatus Anstonellales archaeon]
MVALSVDMLFLMLGGIVFIGYLGELIAKRFSIPSILLLLLVGYGLKAAGYVEPSSIIGMQEFFSILALVILLFDGGLSLDLDLVMFKSGRVLLMSTIIMALSIISCAVLLNYLLGISLIAGGILGAIIGGTGATVTISMLRGLKVPSEVSQFLTLESSITDVFSIIIVIVLTQALISGSIDVQSILQGVASKFSIGIFLGLIIGILSFILLDHIEKGYNYMITFALVLLLYTFVEFLSGSGAISVLAFGLVFGNEQLIRRAFRIENSGNRFTFTEFQSEVSFLVRTFFFVFLGAIVSVSLSFEFYLSIGLVALLLIIRYASALVSTMGSQLADYKSIITAIGPRGLATAVLATYPMMKIGQAIPQGGTDHLTSIASEVASFPEISLYIIVMSIVASTFLVPFAAKGARQEPEKQGTKGKEQQSNS